MLPILVFHRKGEHNKEVKEFQKWLQNKKKKQQKQV